MGVACGAPNAVSTTFNWINDKGDIVGFDSDVTHGIIYNTKTGTFTTLDDV
jgi:hypothetical protein